MNIGTCIHIFSPIEIEIGNTYFIRIFKSILYII